MLNLEKIYHTPGIYHKRWQSIAKHKTPQVRFLVCVVPLLEYTYQQLLPETKKVQDKLSNGFLLRFLKSDLVMRLTPLLSRCGALEMHSALDRKYVKGKTSDERFARFVALLAEPDNAWAIVDKYSDLKVCLAHLITEYITAMTEFLTQFAADHDRLVGDYIPSGALLHKISASGDTHREGRRVFICFFKQDKTITKLVYKPRALDVDEAFDQLLAWVNAKQSQLFLYRPQFLNLGDHGWCAFVDQQPCMAPQQVRAFYQRSGALLGLLYFLGGSDIHYENLIAHGEHPVLIDLECLFKPTVMRTEFDKKCPYRPFVSDSLMLPYRLEIDKDSQGFDISAMSGAGGEMSPFKVMQWEGEGTDKMRIVRKSIMMTGSNNLPTLKGKAVDSLNYIDAMVAGFEHIYRLFMQHKKALQGARSPLQAFAKCDIRVLYRATGDYAKLLNESYHPKLLYYPKERNQHLNWLKDILPFLPAYKAVVPSERKDLDTGNIPFFSAKANSKVVQDGLGKNVKGSLLTSGWDNVQNHFNRDMGEHDLALQKQLIENSFAAMRANMSIKTGGREAAHVTVKLDEAANGAQLNARLIAQARRVFTILLERKVNRGKFVYWPTLEMSSELAWNPSFTEPDLYGGLPGIGLAFAYGAVLLKDKAYHDIAVECVEHIVEICPIEYAHGGPQSVLKNVGGFSGIGGLLYYLGAMLELKIGSAKKIKSTISLLLEAMAKVVKDDTELDIISGSAGGLGALFAVQAYVPKAVFDKLAKALVAHLLKQYPNPDVLPLSATQNHKKPLLGFSHGVAGIAWALSKYYAYAPTPKVKKWVNAALAYERKQFVKRLQNWPDFREDTTASAPKKSSKKVQSMHAWCHGAPGVGLGRLEMLDWDADCKTEAHVALKSTLKSGFQSGSCLCHGILGNMDLLLQAQAQGLDWVSEAQCNTHKTMVADYFERQGVLAGLQAEGAMTGLMTGSAGVAYQLLRLVHPDKVPSVLLLQKGK